MVYWEIMNLMYLNLQRDSARREILMDCTNNWVSVQPEVYSVRVIGWY